jgi:hypothetical protein
MAKEAIMTKTIYRILSLYNGTPVYRVYDYCWALTLLQAVRERWGDIFWVEQQEREVECSDSFL